MRRYFLGAAGILAAGLGLLLSGGGAKQPSLTERVQGQRRMMATQPPPALAILSPPGAGYDSTNVALYTATGNAVTISRASEQRCTNAAGSISTVAANKPCVADGALLVEPGATNLLLHSADFTNAAWLDADGTPTVTADQAEAPDGTASMDEIANGTQYQSMTVTSSTGPWTVSAWVRASSGTSSQTVRFQCSGVNVATCSCTRSDGGACTATIDATVCHASASVGTSSVRLSATGTCTTAVTSILAAYQPGTYGAPTGTGLFWCGQTESGSVATSCIPTTTATASRAAQTTTVATPSGLSTTEGAAKLCVTPSFTGNVPGSGTQYLLSGNAGGTALFAIAFGGNSIIRISDGTNAASVEADFVANTRKCYRMSWSASRSRLLAENLTSAASGTSAAFTALGAFDATIGVGATAAGAGAFTGALLDSVCLSATPDGCR